MVYKEAVCHVYKTKVHLSRCVGSRNLKRCTRSKKNLDANGSSNEDEV